VDGVSVTNRKGIMQKIRGFEKVSQDQYENNLVTKMFAHTPYEELKLPQRATLKSSGYDFFSPIEFELYPGEIIKFPTGIRAYMLEDEELKIYVRSSMGFKYNVRLLNQVGKIDSDYYMNPDNEGHIWIGLKNEGDKIWKVNIGDKIAQGSFYKYLLADEDVPANILRVGGIESTGK
jgi:dUTP pyrophosphatase